MLLHSPLRAAKAASMPVPPGYASRRRAALHAGRLGPGPRALACEVTCARREPCPPAKRRWTTASPTTARLPAGEALALLERRIRPVVATESVPLAAAHGRILAETVIAERDVPGFDNVAVDGFAFAHRDLAEGRRRSGCSRSAPRPGIRSCAACRRARPCAS